MLTTKQQGLFKLLGFDVEQEKEIRQRHKVCVKDFGAVKDFTTWLTKVLHKRWESERRTSVYLGD
jgi:hypothetical protein